MSHPLSYLLDVCVRVAKAFGLTRLPAKNAMQVRSNLVQPILSLCSIVDGNFK